jgi:hypothetical protein
MRRNSLEAAVTVDAAAVVVDPAGMDVVVV